MTPGQESAKCQSAHGVASSCSGEIQMESTVYCGAPVVRRAAAACAVGGAGTVIATSHYDAALANQHYARLEGLCPPP